MSYGARAIIANLADGRLALAGRTSEAELGWRGASIDSVLPTSSCAGIFD